jgi:hypothetical protein
MSFVTDSQLKTRIAAQLKQDSSSLPTYWDTIITDARNSAYREIQAALLQRGYTAAQIAAWDRGAEFEIDIGLFWALVKGAGMKGEDIKFIQLLDRRKELAVVDVTNSDVLQTPEPAATPIGYGALDDSQSTFVYSVDRAGDVTKTSW